MDTFFETPILIAATCEDEKKPRIAAFQILFVSIARQEINVSRLSDGANPRKLIRFVPVIEVTQPMLRPVMSFQKCGSFGCRR